MNTDTVSPDVFPANQDEAVDLGNLILMAYTMASDPSQLNPQIPQGFPPQYTVLANVIMKDFLLFENPYQFYGFLAHKNGTSEYCIVMRGTLTVIEWIEDLFSIIPIPFFSYGYVGDAWAQIYNTMRTTPRLAALSLDDIHRMEVGSFASQVTKTIQAHAAQHGLTTSSLTVSCAGHSLGAALVTLYTLERLGEDASYPIRSFYTFASPRVGDTKFANAFNGQPFPKFRAYFAADEVPDLPPVVGFVQVGFPVPLKLDPTYLTWELCVHSMNTHMHAISAGYPPSPCCTSLFCETRDNSAAMVRRRAVPAATMARGARSPALEGASSPSVEVRRTPGDTKITITIETGGKGCC